MADGITARMTTRGHSPESLVAALKDQRSAFDQLKALLTDPSSYEGSRFEGRGTMPHGGPRKGPRERRDDDSVGYPPHVRVRRTKRKLRVDSSRPHLPALTPAAEDEVASTMLRDVLERSIAAAKLETLP